jgi:hypothetical protein
LKNQVSWSFAPKPNFGHIFTQKHLFNTLKTSKNNSSIKKIGMKTQNQTKLDLSFLA